MIIFQLLLAQILVFGALVIVMRYLLKRNIGSASSHIQELTRDCTQKLEEAKKKMEEANQYREKVLADSKEEGEQLKQQLIREGRQVKEEMLQQARQQSEEIVHRAQASAENLMAELEQKIESRSAAKASEMVKELMVGKLSEEAHSRWIQELVQNGFDNLRRLNLPDGLKEAEVVTAFPLKPSEKSLLKDRLSEVTGKTINLKEQVDPELILGVRLTMGRVVIDGSWRSKAEEFLRHEQGANNR